jgi:hypothetical protein
MPTLRNFPASGEKSVIGVDGLSRLGSILVISLPLIFHSAPASADMKQVVTFLLEICMGGGRPVEVERFANGDVAQTLRELRSSNLAFIGPLSHKYSKADWRGFQARINAHLMRLHPRQAETARKCLVPYWSGIVQAAMLATKP